jgi:hypothetical protein
LLQNTPISELKLAIKAPGFSLLKYKAKKYTISFNLNTLPKNNKGYYLLPNTQLSYLNEQLSSETEVVNVFQDTIFVNLGRSISKKVPVALKLDINFKLGYNFIEELLILPDSVLITGPEKYIDSISEISTIPFELNDVYENINTELLLQLPPNNKKIVLSSNKIMAIGKVDKFTEGNFTIPVAVINEPEGVKINPFPKEINVTYQVGLTNFNKIDENSVSIVFDYNEYKNDTLIRFLTPIIQQKSDFIYSLKINPNQIEFLIQK